MSETLFLNYFAFNIVAILHLAVYLPLFLPHCATAPSGPGPPHFRGFTITLRHSAIDRTPLDEWSARRRDHYQTTHNTHKKQKSMSPVGLEPAIPERERLLTHALDRADRDLDTDMWSNHIPCGVLLLWAIRVYCLHVMG
jgi:hypothetical protein